MDLNRENTKSSKLTEKSSKRQLKQILTLIPKDKTITIRLPEELIGHFKNLADKKNTKYQKLMRQALIDFIGKTN